MSTRLLFIFLLLSQFCSAKTSLPVTFTHDSLTIYARLQLPDGAGKFPVIVIAPGSGPSDKDGTLPMVGSNIACLYPGLMGDTLRYYKGLSEAFSDSGYAVLTYDKVEYTYPTVSPITFHKLWLPVASAMAYLKTRNDIDTNQIVLLGHSEGSTLIPYIARTETGVKALISLAGPRRPLDSMLAYQLVYIAQTCNGSVAMATAQGNQILQYCDMVRTGNYTSSTPPMLGVSADVWADYLHVSDSVSINYNLANKPTLFIGLQNDINVPVATELSRFQNEVTIGANFYSLPDLNHYLATPTNPQVSEALTDTVIYWLRSRNIVPTNVSGLSNELNNISVTVQDGEIHFTSAKEMVQTVRITDMQGKLIAQQAVNDLQGRISFKGNAAGIYITEIITRRGKRRFKIAIP